MNYSGAASSRIGGGGRVHSSRSNNGGREPMTDFADLVQSSNGKNWKGVFISLLVIMLILSIIVLAIILVTPDTNNASPLISLTLDDILNSNMKPRHASVQWTAVGERYVVLSGHGDLVEMHVESNASTVILSNETLSAIGAERWAISPDARYVLLATDIKQVRSYSLGVASYVIFDRQSPHAELLRVPAQSYVTSQTSAGPPLVQYAGWSSPAGHLLSYIINNNIFVQFSPTSDPIQVTFFGKPGLIFCGVPDWLYEEEVIRSGKTHWISPDERHLAYICIDVTNVPVHRFPVYGSADGPHSIIDDIRYPKAGDGRHGVLPVAELFVADISSPFKQHHRINTPAALAHLEHYITLVQWRNDAELLVAWSNRRQNSTWLTLCSVAKTINTGNDTDCQTILREASPAWILMNDILAIDNGEHLLAILAEPEIVSGPWKHIALISIDNNAVSRKAFVTQGSAEVVAIVGYSADNSTLFYLAANSEEGSRHLYSVQLSNKRMRVDEKHDVAKRYPRQQHGLARPKPHCESCSLDGGCHYVSAQFSPTARHYVIGCLGPGIPRYSLRSTFNHSVDVLLEDNSDLSTRLAAMAMPRREFFYFTNSEGYEIRGQLLLPPALNKAHITRYPVLVHVDGEPGTQSVTKEFNVDWNTYLSSSENVIVVQVDGRGTSGRGDRFLHQLHRRLGTVEVLDQISAVSFLKSKFHFIDAENIAIWGSSYGGFVTLHTLAEDEDDIFRCGIAVSPITDWKYYDSVKAERLMGFADRFDNYRGYDNANVSARASSMRNKELLLVHSISDERVHFQHSAHLMRSLIEADVDYTVHLYSDVPHDALPQTTTSMTECRLSSSIGRPLPLYGCTTSGSERMTSRWIHVRRHAYHTLLRFLKSSCWNSSSTRLAA